MHLKRKGLIICTRTHAKEASNTIGRKYFLKKQLYYKGQYISKCLFGIFNSSKKRAKKFDLTTMIPEVELFSFVFLEN